jgi:hypothetical protein
MRQAGGAEGQVLPSLRGPVGYLKPAVSPLLFTYRLSQLVVDALRLRSRRWPGPLSSPRVHTVLQRFVKDSAECASKIMTGILEDGLYRHGETRGG